MKIAHLTPTLWKYSGIDRVVENEAYNDAKKENIVEIFCLDAKFKIPKTKINKLGIPDCLLLQRIYRLIFFLDVLKLINLTSTLKKFDILIAHQYPMTLPAMLAKLLYKKTYIYRDYGIPPLWTFPKITEKFYILLFRLFTKISILNANRIVSISHFLAQEIKKETNKPVTVIPPTVKVKSVSKNQIKKTKKRLKILPQHKILLFIGRLSPHKGIHLLIKAINKIPNPNLRLFICGKPTFPKYEKTLKNLIKDNRIILTGHISDNEKWEYYAICDLYVSPSLWEGYNLPLKEALELGKPAIAFDIGPHSELLPPQNLIKLGKTENDKIDNLVAKIQELV